MATKGRTEAVLSRLNALDLTDEGGKGRERAIAELNAKHAAKDQSDPDDYRAQLEEWIKRVGECKTLKMLNKPLTTADQAKEEITT